ncbi:MAG: daunorubicin resistance transporter ATP-binding subunit [Acidimicrobiia bacterium]|nr:daunorubicin resistance transporter ATP-binding subunit [Acidimicrobiia bacterium]
MTSIIEARGVAKRFGKVEALAGIDLVAERGRVLALLGPNGAGKTTFVRCVATLMPADAGSLTVCGFDVARQPDEVRQSIGLAGQYAAVEGAMTGRENLVMVARLFGQERRAARKNADRVLEQLNLSDAGDRLVRTYSGGMRRRLDLGASLVGTPRLLLLDEPSTGLDPRSRADLWEAIRALVAAGTDMLLTTQYMEEADQLASDVVIIDHGRVIAAGTPNELKQQAGRDVIEARVHTDADLDVVYRILAEVGESAPTMDRPTLRVTVPVQHGTEELMAGLRSLDAAGITLDDIGLRRPTLDEVFLSLTGRPVEETAEAAR